MTETDPTAADRVRAIALLEAANFLRTAHYQDGMTVQEIGAALLNTADDADPMAASLYRDGHGPDEITAMLAAVEPPADQADLPELAARATVLRELEQRYREHARNSVHPDFRAAYAAVANDLSRLAVEAHDTGTQQQDAAESHGDTLPAWLHQRFGTRGRYGQSWDALSDDDRAYWEHHARAVRRAVDRGGFKPAPVAQQPVALRAELKPWQLLADQPDEPLPQTERVIGGRRLATTEQQAAAADGEETQS